MSEFSPPGPDAPSSRRDRERTGPPGGRRVVIITAAVVAVVVFIAIAAVAVLAPRSVDALSSSPTVSPTPVVPSRTAVASPSPTPTPSPTATPTFDKSAFSLDDPTSIWVVVNKLRPLAPADYEPNRVPVPVPFANEPYMRQDASDAVVSMFAAFAAETGLQMQSQSAYRSYSSQENVYAGWVATYGQAGADLTSARPGHSEHQTGLAMDVSALPANCSLDACFADTPQGQWLAANGWRFGFIVRYPANKTPVTGFEYEPWHMRYVGVDLSTEMHATGITTLEEFFGLPAAPGYAE